MKMTDADVQTQQRKAMRRRQGVAAALLAGAAIAFWGASRLTWATVEAEDGLSPQRAFHVKGADWSPWLTPLALVLLAAIAVAFTVRGLALRLLALLIAAGGLLAAFPAVSLLVDGGESDYAARAGDIPDRFRILLVNINWVAPVVVLVGTACTVGAAVMLLRVVRAADPSSKYTTPAVRREEAEREIFADYERRKAAQEGGAPAETEESGTANERMMWDALDTGIDPTDPDDGDTIR
ncbi:TIGR02234 family membrane protein [Gordonia sp. ABSL1-1]|uniref:TIGR02234 family membrane protein n=1 Tax=Gordonia sp. ABSL1-1 TaxID=3053923 RepID=UPI002573993D|nr:TIGR02234 family membrane protein [Gordonia sp. ABSL1-1]MDL9937467.1 TIGR02234 family membrane protein [Gordonia sp. ABSL1-1]